MKHTTTHKTATFELVWSLTVAEGEARTLELEYQLTAFEELYLADRLWDHDRAGRRIADPYGVYRFVKDGGLWLVFAQAPWRPEVRLENIYTPLCSRVRAGEARRHAVSIALPVDEYSALARNVAAETTLVQVSRVTLVLGHRLRASMDADPLPPPFESAEQAGYIVDDHAMIVSSLAVDPLPVKRRTGAIARFAPPDPRPPSRP
ncbi:MAG TPA: hypothetical protein VGB85_17760 [Nannocystis sp.]|jgi:hypothetical protein